MKNIALLLVLLFYSSEFCIQCTSNSEIRTPNSKAIKIILDTDFGPDYDDVGALAFLHCVADSGRVEILATITCNKYKLTPPCIEIVNTFFGKPGLPIGAPKDKAVDMGDSQHWSDSLVEKYPHKIKTTNDVPDAVEVYRKILSSQPDKSVTIVTIGFLTNLSNLLKSPPDKFSNLGGKDLVQKKVKKLVSMAGKFPQGKEFNIYTDAQAAAYVYKNWTAPVIFTGFEIGEKIKTGLRLIKQKINNNPVKDVFRISINKDAEDRDGRMSWDETAVLIASYGTTGFFNEVKGKIVVSDDGSNSWKNDENGKDVCVVQKLPANQMSKFIEDRMMYLPKKK